MARDVRTNYIIGVRDRATKQIAGIRRAIGGLNAAFASIGAGLSLASVTAFTAQASRAADEINKLSDRLGVSTEALSEYRFVAQQTGVEFNTFSTALQRAQRRISDASEGTGPAVDALRELGINAAELTQLDPAFQFEVLAEALSRVENESRRVALAQKVLDSEGVRLLQTFLNGAIGIQELREEFRKLGGTLDQTTADIGSELQDAIGRLQASSNAAALDLLRNFGPALTQIINQIATGLPKSIDVAVRSFANFSIGLGRIERAAAEFLGLDRVVDALSDSIAANEKLLEDLNAEAAKTAAVFQGTARAADFLDESLKATAKSAVDLTQKSSDTVAAITGVTAAIESFRSSVGEISANRESFITRYGTDAQQAAQAIRQIEQAGRAAAVSQEEINDAVARFVVENELIADSAGTAITEVASETDETLRSIERQVDRFSNNLVDSVFDASNTIGDIFKDLVNNIAQEFFRLTVADPISQGLKGLLGNITSGGGFDLGKLFSGFFATGGFIPPGTFGVVGERGPEFVAGGRQGATVTPMSGANVNLTFNVNTLDGRQAASVLAENRDFIVGMIQGAFNRAGTGARMA